MWAVLNTPSLSVGYFWSSISPIIDYESYLYLSCRHHLQKLMWVGSFTSLCHFSSTPLQYPYFPQYLSDRIDFPAKIALLSYFGVFFSELAGRFDEHSYLTGCYLTGDCSDVLLQSMSECTQLSSRRGLLTLFVSTARSLIRVRKGESNAWKVTRQCRCCPLVYASFGTFQKLYFPPSPQFRCHQKGYSSYSFYWFLILPCALQVHRGQLSINLNFSCEPWKLS